MFPRSPRLAYREMVPGDLDDMAQPVDGVTELEVGYHVLPAWQNRGLASEAAAACRDFAQMVLGASRLVAIIHPGNVPSQRVAARIGLRPEKRTVVHGGESIIFAASLDEPHGK